MFLGKRYSIDMSFVARRGGSIDPAGFVDTDGTIYVVWKIDGNNIGHGGNCNNGVEPIEPTPIMMQRMAADGVNPDGDAFQILDRGMLNYDASNLLSQN